MFSKLKSKKAPLSLSNVSNALKSSGSPEVPLPEVKMKDIDLFPITQIGLEGQVVAVAHDPIQSLLAIATAQGDIRVYGRGSVQVIFDFNSRSQWIDVRFVRGVYLVAISSSNITVISLHQKKVLQSHSPGGVITSIASDPACDFVALGLHNGSILFYDVDRLNLTPMRLDNLQKKILPKEKLSHVHTLEWHPRQPGAILASYNHCAVMYNLATGQMVGFFREGEPKRGIFRSIPILDVVEAHFHPNGLHVAVLYVNGELSIFDGESGKIITTRSELAGVNLLSFRWLAMKDPELTQIVIAGDHLYSIDLGLTLKYSLTSLEKQAQFYNSPTIQQYSATSGEKIIPICSNPYFNGCGDPYSIMLISDGIIRLVPFPSKSITLAIPPSLSLVCNKAIFSTIEMVKKVDWYSVASSQYGGISESSFVSGGAPAPKSVRPLGLDDACRNILITGHENGSVRLVEANKTDDGSEQVDFSLHRQTPVLCVSAAIAARELVAVIPGEIVLCKYGKPKSQPASNIHSHMDLTIKSIQQNGVKSSISTFFPHSSIEIKEKVTAISVNDTGFAAICFDSGRLVVLDVSRGPAIILNDKLSHFVPSVSDCVGETVCFSIQEYNNEGFSSIILSVGGTGGVFVNFKIIPQPNGAFECVFADKTIGLTYREATSINNIIPVSFKGDSAVGSLDIFHRLATGVVIPAYMIISSSRDVRTIRLPKQKLAHKVFDDEIGAVGLIRFRGGTVLGVYLKTGVLSLLSIPQLNDVFHSNFDKETNKLTNSVSTQHSSYILETGEIYVAKSAAEYSIVTPYLKGSRKPERVTDKLFNENVIYPLKPQTGMAQWVKGGSQYLNSDDLALLIAGPNRKAAKYQESELAYNISPEANPNQGYGTTPAENKGYKDPVRKADKKGGYGYNFGGQGFMRSLQDGLNTAEETFHGYANNLSETVNEGVSSSTSSFYSAAIKHKAGF